MADFLFGKRLAKDPPKDPCLEGQFICSASVVLAPSHGCVKLLGQGYITSYHGPLPGCSPRVVGGSAGEVCESALRACVPMPPIMAARYVKKAVKPCGGSGVFVCQLSSLKLMF